MEGLMQPDVCEPAFCCGRKKRYGSARFRRNQEASLRRCSIVANCRVRDVDAVVGTGGRQARRIVSSLLERGVLQSDSSRAPLRLTFPAALAHRWMPGLFPEKVD